MCSGQGGITGTCGLLETMLPRPAGEKHMQLACDFASRKERLQWHDDSEWMQDTLSGEYYTFPDSA